MGTLGPLKMRKVVGIESPPPQGGCTAKQLTDDLMHAIVFDRSRNKA